MALPRIQMSGKDPAHYKAYKKHTHMFKYMNIFLRKSWVLMTGTPVAHSPAQAEWSLSGNTTRLSP